MSNKKKGFDIRNYLPVFGWAEFFTVLYIIVIIGLCFYFSKH